MLVAVACAWSARVPQAWSLDAFDAGRLASERQRELATRDLESARQRVAAAKTAVDEAKRRLDAFVAGHFQDLKSQAADTLPEPPPAEAARPAAPATMVREGDAARFSQQIEELSAKRLELLQRLTPAHPEVVDLDARITELSSRLQEIEAPAAGRESLPVGEPTATDPHATALAEHVRNQQERHKAAVEQYELVYRAWESAQQEFEAAENAERAAQRQLAGLAPAATSSEPQPEAAEQVMTSRDEVGAAAAPDTAVASRGGQDLVFAALVVALAIAALAAVRLAKASNDNLFTNVDDIAAALALPVVGVFPVARRTPSGLAARLTSLAILASQVALAVAVFALVAYCVLHLGEIGHAIANPLETLRGH
jgi:hypothetical protein